MNKYTVVLAFDTENGLTAVIRFDNDAVIEMDSVNDDGNEVYTIETEYNIDGVLDNASHVISYEKVSE